jgi:hypothetical protein
MEIFENTATRKSDSAGHFIKKVGWQLLRRAATSGTMGGLAAAMAASVVGKYENDSFAAPLNATSHIIWGDEAARQDCFSLKYTLTGFLLNHVSAIFWALFYEKLFGKHTAKRQQATPSVSKPNDGSMIQPLLGATAVAAGAYVVDYYLIPRRFTPGFEKRVSGKSLAAILAGLAIGLAARDIINARADKARF